MRADLVQYDGAKKISPALAYMERKDLSGGIFCVNDKEGMREARGCEFKSHQPHARVFCVKNRVTKNAKVPGLIYFFDKKC